MERFYAELREIFRMHGWVASRRGKKVSIATFHIRQEHLQRELYRLRSGHLIKKENGALVRQPRFAIPTPYALRRKHIQALLNDWSARGLSTSYIHNLLSMFRTLAGWIEKPGLVPPTADLITDPAQKRRCQVATRDKSWTGAGLDVPQKLRAISDEDPTVGMVLELMAAFALRLKEASALHPWMADNNAYLDVNRGTKGRLRRIVPITTDDERDVLERAKALVLDHTACLIPRGMKYRQWEDRVYYVLKKNGISRKLVGTSTHGLRHERLHRLYEVLTGVRSPVQGGGPVDRDADRYARAQVAATAGHSRPAVASCYLGRVMRGALSGSDKPQCLPSNTTAETIHTEKGEPL